MQEGGADVDGFRKFSSRAKAEGHPYYRDGDESDFPDGAFM
jgi:hypothetical protein